MALVIDSRTLVTYPYQHMEPDKEHFIGAEMETWADKVFEIIQQDLSTHPLPLALTSPPGISPAKLDPIASRTGPRAASANGARDGGIIQLKAKLVAKSKPTSLKDLQ